MRLTRLDSSLLGFLVIFLPLYVRTTDLALSVRRAVPLLFICMCTFIANDLDDLERDTVNHPDRPLPIGQVTAVFATSLYFVVLAAALFSTRQFVTEGISFLYYTLIAFSISYSYVVEYIPSFKAPYVGVVCTLPVLIVASWYPDETKLYLIAGSVFLLTTGREICMDIKDRSGDVGSYLQTLDERRVAIGAFVIETSGLTLLGLTAGRLGELFVLFTMVGLLGLAAVYWFKYSKHKRAIVLLKVQFFAGLYFLV